MGRRDSGLKLTAEEIAASFSSLGWAERYPPVMTVEQVAGLLQVPKHTVYDWSSRGLLKGCSRRVGKHLRFYRDKLISQVFNEGIGSDGR